MGLLSPREGGEGSGAAPGRPRPRPRCVPGEDAAPGALPGGRSCPPRGAERRVPPGPAPTAAPAALPRHARSFIPARGAAEAGGGCPRSGAARPVLTALPAPTAPSLVPAASPRAGPCPLPRSWEAAGPEEPRSPGIPLRPAPLRLPGRGAAGVPSSSSSSRASRQSPRGPGILRRASWASRAEPKRCDPSRSAPSGAGPGGGGRCRRSGAERSGAGARRRADRSGERGERGAARSERRGRAPVAAPAPAQRRQLRPRPQLPPAGPQPHRPARIRLPQQHRARDCPWFPPFSSVSFRSGSASAPPAWAVLPLEAPHQPVPGLLSRRTASCSQAPYSTQSPSRRPNCAQHPTPYIQSPHQHSKPFLFSPQTQLYPPSLSSGSSKAGWE